MTNLSSTYFDVDSGYARPQKSNIFLYKIAQLEFL